MACQRFGLALAVRPQPVRLARGAGGRGGAEWRLPACLATLSVVVVRDTLWRGVHGPAGRQRAAAAADVTILDAAAGHGCRRCLWKRPRRLAGCGVVVVGGAVLSLVGRPLGRGRLCGGCVLGPARFARRGVVVVDAAILCCMLRPLLQRRRRIVSSRKTAPCCAQGFGRVSRAREQGQQKQQRTCCHSDAACPDVGWRVLADDLLR